MRKILITIIIVLLLVFGYVSLSKGIEIGNLKISSIKQIDENSKLLEQKTEEVNTYIDVEYPKKRTELVQAANKMQDTKKRYLDETNLSTDTEIQSALQIESYDIEKLWTKLGNHATSEGVNLKLVLNSSSSGSTDTKDLAFTVNGSYIGITNFIYNIEDDDELNFRIYNFKMLPYQNDILQASFIVKDVRITSTSLNESLTSSIQNSSTEENTQKGTNTENTQSNTTTQNTIEE